MTWWLRIRLSNLKLMTNVTVRLLDNFVEILTSKNEESHSCNKSQTMSVERRTWLNLRKMSNLFICRASWKRQTAIADNSNLTWSARIPNRSKCQKKCKRCNWKLSAKYLSVNRQSPKRMLKSQHSSIKIKQLNSCKDSFHKPKKKSGLAITKLK